MGWVPTIPVRAYWNLSIPATRYAFGSLEVDEFVATYTSLTATNMILDMIILAIPAPLLLYNKTSNMKSRWALICLRNNFRLTIAVLQITSIAEVIATKSIALVCCFACAAGILLALNMRRHLGNVGQRQNAARDWVDVRNAASQ